MCNMKFHHSLILVYIHSEHSEPRIVQLHEKPLNSSEGKEYERRNLKCICTLKWPEPLLKLFSDSGLQG